MPRVILFIACCAVLAMGGGMVRSAMVLAALAFASLCAWIAWQLVRIFLGRP
ncbi:hypothetical protein [Comamonas badia]|uniref:hypothetical protein n=1 Tax=Comamonas badia TaxID=265291 RepID=UPI000409B138|nr:hypothetical protein [Comamonas badia]